MKPRAVFLDKDGTLVENVPYNVDPDKIKLNAGAREGLQALHNQGYLLVVISNQPGVARGHFRPSALRGVYERLTQLLQDCDVPLAGFFACPHDPHGRISEYSIRCGCRKPAAGLLHQAAHELHINLQRSWLIGDILDDVEAGHVAGCKTVLLDVGNETEWIVTPRRTPDFLARDLHEAAQVVLHHPVPLYHAGALR